MMREKPVLVLAIILTLIVEVILMILVYNKVGGERLPAQIGRFVFQLILIFYVLSQKTNAGLFILTAYHIISGLLFFYSSSSKELIGQILMGYHFIIGLIIYFHDWIEDKLGLSSQDLN